MQNALTDDDFKARLAESADFQAMLAASNEQFRQSLARSEKRIKEMVWRSTMEICAITVLICFAWLSVLR